MANKIKGITIEIGGNTQPLNKALSDVNKKTRDVQSELKQVERLLKLDPKNTELIAQKQKLLGDAVENSREKLDRLRATQEQVNEQFKKGEISEEQYRAFQREVVKAEQDLQKFEKQLSTTVKTTSSWKDKLDNASKSLKSAGEKMTGIGKNLSTTVTAPIVAAGGAILALGIKAGQTADRLLDLRDITGLSTDSIQEWQYVANQAGVESETMTKAVEGLVRKIPQLESEAGRATEQLAKMGITFADLKEMSPDEQMDTLMNMLAEMEDPLERNAIGAQLFGGAWKDLAPILGMGADGIAAVRQEARDLGLVLDEDSIVKANEFRQQMDKLKASVSAIVFSIGAELGPVLKDELGPIINDTIVPALKSMTESIGKLVKWFADLSPASQKTVLALVGILAALGPVLLILGPLVSAIGSVVGAIGALGVASAAGATGVGILTTAFPALGGVLAAITGPIGIVIAAIGALITAGVLLYKNWDKVKAYFIQAWESMKVAVLRINVKIIEAMEKLYGWIPKIGNAVKASASAARKALEEETIRMEKAKQVWNDIQELDQESVKKTSAGLRETANILDEEVVPSFEGVSKSASGAGKAMAVTAETTKAAWEILAENLKTKLAQTKISFEIAGNQLDMTGDKVQQLKNSMDSLTSQIDIQREVVEATVKGYEQMKIEKGENSEEAQKLKLKVLEEQKALSDLEKQLYDTTNALKDHAQEFRDLAVEVEKVEKKYKDDLVAALEDYQQKVESVNRKVREEEQRTTAEYNRAVEERTRALSNFVGLFDEVAGRDVSGESLLSNLRGQVAAFEDWQKNIQELAAKGVDEGLIAELQEMGPKAGPEIAALNTLTDEQLAEYVSLWKKKNQEAREEAINQLQQQRVEMQQKLMEIRQSANEQLELYRVEWEKKNAEIRKNAEEEMKRIEEKFQSIAKAGTTYGVELMSNFIGGMESQFERLRRTLEEIAMTVDSYMPHSPAKVGPLKRLAEWGPALIETFAGGILSNLPILENAMSKMASSLVPTMANPVTSNTISNNYGGNVFHIHVSGGGSREQAEDIMRELHRLGVRF